MAERVMKAFFLGSVRRYLEQMHRIVFLYADRRNGVYWHIE